MAHKRPPIMTRRQFAVAGTQAVGAVVGVMLAVPIVGWILDPLFHPRPLVWRRVADISKVPYELPTPFTVPFPVQASWPVPESPYLVYVVKHRDGSVDAFSNICSHMQCPVRWTPPLGLFLCPCHGGLYNIRGVNVGGPPPKPLPKWESRFENGVLYVRNQLTEAI
jgi:menaquinol-cytochrome c reductase iron-sulfur subunit